MTKSVVRLDTSRDYATVHGEHPPEHPQYGVHYWQSYKIGKKTVPLPFDAQQIVMPDTGSKEQVTVLIEGKPVVCMPLYNQEMRDLVAKLEARGSKSADAAEAEGQSDEHAELDNEQENIMAPAVNFVAWLKGEARYEWTVLVAAGKRKFFRQFTSKKEMVVELVLDQKLVTEDQLSDEFKKLLPAKAA